MAARKTTATKTAAKGPPVATLDSVVGPFNFNGTGEGNAVTQILIEVQRDHKQLLERVVRLETAATERAGQRAEARAEKALEFQSRWWASPLIAGLALVVAVASLVFNFFWRPVPGFAPTAPPPKQAKP